MGQSPVKWIQLITETLIKKKKPHNLRDEDSSGIQAKETMKTHTENHMERVRRNLLSPRQPANIATWNIRTMFTAGKTTVIADEMRRYRVSILGLCKTSWLQSGEVKLVVSPYSTLDTQMKKHHTRREWHLCSPKKHRGPSSAGSP